MNNQPSPSRGPALHLVLNDFRPDYRVLKEVVALAEHGWTTTVFAIGGRDRQALEMLNGVTVQRMPIRTRGLKLGMLGLAVKYIECATRMVVRGTRAKPNVVHAHDLNTLPVGWLIARLTGAHLIYDSHEYWADSGHRRVYPAFLYNLVIALEKSMAPRARRVITVSQGIAELLMREIGLRSKPVVIRNVPEAATVEAPVDLRARFGLPPSSVLLLFIGGILPDRGIEHLLQALSRTSDHVHLVFLGAPGLPDWLRKNIPNGVYSRLHFIPPVPPREVAAFAAGADIGIVATRGSNLSHLYSLPNKLFESIQVGLAVIATDLPEIARIVREYECGRTFSDGDSDDLAATIDSIAGSPDELQRMKAAGRQAGKELVWENERHRLIEVYDQIGRT